MHKSLYNRYFSGSKVCVYAESNNVVQEGYLEYSGRKVPITKGIPRFVEDSGEYDNFAIQWNAFSSTQLDKVRKRHSNRNRLFSNTGWEIDDMKNKTVLEAGSGAGRYTEVLLDTGASVVSFDYTKAVDANYNNNMNDNLFLFQGDIYDIPFEDNYFDYIFCYGVLQHTPYPEDAFKMLFNKLKPKGKLSIDYYVKMDRPSVWYTPKYIWRPFTTKIPKSLLLKWVKLYVPLWLPFDTFIKHLLYKIPRFGHMIAGLIPIPCWNYLGSGMGWRERLQWAILDTYDALGAAYDKPKTMDEVVEMVSLDCAEVESVFYGSNGIVANVIKSGEKA